MKTLDTRDLYTRKCELESLRDAVTEAHEALTDFEASGDDSLESETHENLKRNLESAESEFDLPEEQELAELENLESEIGRGFMHGETMIPESDFEKYARELAKDTCDMGSADNWPFTCIDWERAAKELAMDYTSVTYQGTEYLVRA